MTARRRRAAAGVLALSLLGSACGSRQDHADHEASLRALAAADAANADDAIRTSAPSGSSTSGTGTAPSETTGDPAGGSTGTATRPSTADGSSATTAAPTASACTGEEHDLVIGTVGQQSGIAGGATHLGVQAVQAWAATLNRAGGLRCHHIRYVIADDGGDPSRHQALVQRLVEQDGVVAFVYMNAVLTGQASIDYLNRERVPVIGSEVGGDWFYTSPMHFPQVPSGDEAQRVTIVGMSAIGRSQGLRRVGVLACIEAQACASANTLAPGFAEEYDLELVYRGTASIAQPDYTSVCQAARDAGTEMLYVALDEASLGRLARSCVSVGFRPLYGGTPSVSSGLAQNPNMDRLVVGLPSVPWFLTSNAEIAAMHRALQSSLPGFSIGGMAVLGWTSAKLLERAAGQLGDVPTSKDVLAGLWTIHDDDLGGLTVPLTFSKDKPAPRLACFWEVAVSGGAWTTPDGGARTCL